jgi:hypothetical protein
VNTPTRRKKSQICQVTTHVFSKEYKLALDASDVGVGAVLRLIFILHCVNKCDGIVISKNHEWMKCTSTCFKDNNKASLFCSIVDYFFLILYVIESRLNDLIYIVNTPTRRKKSQICQVTTHVFSKDYS